jgi:fatty acid desaturase
MGLRDDVAALLGLAEFQKLSSPNKVRYWLDFGVTVAVSYAAFAGAVVSSVSAPEFWCCFVIATLATYRGNFFLHEVVHQGRRLGAFSWAYLLFYGFVHKIPIVAYLPHLVHHEVSHYGDHNDPEYAEWWADPALAVRHMLVLVVVAPAGLMLRFGVFSAIVPWLPAVVRARLYARCSSFVLNPKYERPIDLWPRRTTLVEEYGCFGYTAGFVGLSLAGYVPWTALVVWYAMMTAFFLLHCARAIVNHGYRRFHHTATVEAMIADSRNVIGHPVLSELWGPLGVRYHALHHLFPQLPYHALPAVHVRLLEVLPVDHVYRTTSSLSFVSSFKRGLASRSQAAATPPARPRSGAGVRS